MAIPTQTDSSVILDALKDAMKRALEADYEVLKKEMLERMDRQKDEIIAGILLHLMKRTDFQTLNDRVIVTVHTNPIVVKQ